MAVLRRRSGADLYYVVETPSYGSGETASRKTMRETGEQVQTRPQPLLAAAQRSTPQSSLQAALESTGVSDFELRRMEAEGWSRLFGGERLKIDRFVARHRLGVGGMGEVYLCEDPELGRLVAVKRVRDVGDESQQQRLEQEARALAQFSHPNIVQVYETGWHEGQFFVAMEYVEGENLREWLRASEPEAADVLRCFLEAGRGLVAAHQEGLVHRDFKPENVLRSASGETKVADFGLAKRHRAPSTEDGHHASDLDSGISQPGAAPGTLPYMAPEQLRGGDADERSDQFSFCVALHEALWKLPFSGCNKQEELAAIEAGPPRLPESNRTVFKVIQRGLHQDPARRWPSMEELLRKLERAVEGPRRWTRRIAWAGVGAVFAASLMLVIGPLAPSSACDGGLGGVWGHWTRLRLEAHVAMLSADHSADSGERLVQSLDDWSSEWQATYSEACGDVERTPERECLVRLRHQLDATVQMALEGDAVVLDEALVAAAKMPAPRGCSDRLALRGIDPPPSTLAQQVEAIRAELVMVRVLRLFGRWEDALAAAERLDAAARELGYGSLMAEARGQLAMAQDVGGRSRDAARTYDEAISLAEVERHDDLAAELLIERAELALHELNEPRDAIRFLTQAQDKVERAKLGDRSLARLSFLRARLVEHDDKDQARQHYLAAIELAGETAHEVPEYLDGLASVAEDLETALDYHRRAVRLSTTLFGPRHPRTAKRLYNYGAMLQAAGRGGESQLREAAEIWETGLATEHRWQAKAHQRMAAQSLRHLDFDAVEHHAERMAAILDKALPEEDPNHSEPELILARLNAVMADHEVGDVSVLRRRAVWHARMARRALSNSQADRRFMEAGLLLGNQLMELGDLDDAELELEHTLEYARTGSAELIFEGDILVTKLRQAEHAVRQGDFERADSLLQEISPQRKMLGDEGVSYTLLRGLVDARQVAPGSETPISRECAPLPETYRRWLEDLGASPAEIQQLCL